MYFYQTEKKASVFLSNFAPYFVCFIVFIDLLLVLDLFLTTRSCYHFDVVPQKPDTHVHAKRQFVLHFDFEWLFKFIFTVLKS